MRPAPRQNQPGTGAGQLPVGRVAVTDQEDRAVNVGEELCRGLRAAGGIDVEEHGVSTKRTPQPGAPRLAVAAKLLDAPVGPVGVTDRRPVEMAEDRRRERRQHALRAAERRARRHRKTMVGQPCRDPTGGPHGNEAPVRIEAPYAGPVAGVPEQPRLRRCRHFGRRRRAPAGPAVAGTPDLADMGPDMDPGEFRFMLAIADKGRTAARAGERVPRRLVAFLLPTGVRPPGSAMARIVPLLAPLAPGRLPVPPLAAGAVPVPRQHRRRRTEPFKPGFRLPDLPLPLPMAPFKRPDPAPELPVPVLPPPQRRPQPANLHAQRGVGRALAAVNAGGRRQLPQPLDFRLQARRGPRCQANILQLRPRSLKLRTAPLVQRPVAPRLAPGLNPGAAELPAARLRRVRTRALPPVLRTAPSSQSAKSRVPPETGNRLRHHRCRTERQARNCRRKSPCAGK